MTPYRNRAQGNYSKKENNGREKMKAHTLHAGKPSSVPTLSFWLQVSKRATQGRSHSLGNEADADWLLRRAAFWKFGPRELSSLGSSGGHGVLQTMSSSTSWQHSCFWQPLSTNGTPYRVCHNQPGPLHQHTVHRAGFWGSQNSVALAHIFLLLWLDPGIDLLETLVSGRACIFFQKSSLVIWQGSGRLSILYCRWEIHL